MTEEEKNALELRKVKALEKIANSVDALTIWFEEINLISNLMRSLSNTTSCHRVAYAPQPPDILKVIKREYMRVGHTI